MNNILITGVRGSLGKRIYKKLNKGNNKIYVGDIKIQKVPLIY